LARHGPKPRRCPDRLIGVETLPETRSGPGSQLEHRLRRWRTAALPIAQGALAAGLSWLIAVHIAGHRVPFFASVAAVVCLSVSLGERLRRAIELIVGVAIGVGVGDLSIPRIGTGPWQIALVVALAMSVAVLLDCGAVGTVQAAVSAILVSTLYVPGDAAGLNRVVDGLIGGATGLLAAGVFRRSARAGPPSL
jgi:uncharacterized membrane protein YgaE (UPF0421/DUF939 family)